MLEPLQHPPWLRLWITGIVCLYQKVLQQVTYNDKACSSYTPHWTARPTSHKAFCGFTLSNFLKTLFLFFNVFSVEARHATANQEQTLFQANVLARKALLRWAPDTISLRPTTTCTGALHFESIHAFVAAIKWTQAVNQSIYASKK